MFSFYTIVIMVAIILLLIMLIVVGITLSKRKNTKAFPEYENSCPDFWTFDSLNNKCEAPTTSSGNRLNNANIPVKNSHSGLELHDPSKEYSFIDKINLSKDYWTDICDKSGWASKYGILWDGVTNTNQCV